MMSESEFGVKLVGSGGNGTGTGRSRSGSNASGSVRPLPAAPATMKATSIENESDNTTTSPTSSTVSSSHSFTQLTAQSPQQQQPPQSPSASSGPSPNARLTPSSRSRSSPYVPSPLNPSSGPLLSSSPPSGSTPPVSWRASFSASPLSGASPALSPSNTITSNSSSSTTTPSIVAPIPIKGAGGAPPPPPPGAALPRVSSSSAIGGNATTRSSMTLQKFASEEEELLNSGVQMPLRPRSRPPSTSGSRPASMVLYRLASDDDRTDPFNRPASTLSLNPPNFRTGSISRFSTASQSPSVFSLSSDSKYPVFGSANPFDPPSAPFHQAGYDSSRSSSPGPSLHGVDRSSFYPGGAGTPPSPTSAATPQGAFLPYEYDPAMDQDVVDDDDALHEPDPKGYKEGMGGVSVRGVANVMCLVILVLGLLSLFVVGPAIDAVQKEAFARAQAQPQIVANPVGPASPSDMLSESLSSSSIDDPFNLGSLTPTSTSRSTTSRTTSATSTTLFDDDGNPIDPATATTESASTTRRLGAGGALSSTTDELGNIIERRTAAAPDVRGRGPWAGWKLPRETGAPFQRR